MKEISSSASLIVSLEHPLSAEAKRKLLAKEAFGLPQSLSPMSQNRVLK